MLSYVYVFQLNHTRPAPPPPPHTLTWNTGHSLRFQVIAKCIIDLDDYFRTRVTLWLPFRAVWWPWGRSRLLENNFQFSSYCQMYNRFRQQFLAKNIGDVVATLWFSLPIMYLMEEHSSEYYQYLSFKYLGKSFLVFKLLPNVSQNQTTISTLYSSFAASR